MKAIKVLSLLVLAGAGAGAAVLAKLHRDVAIFREAPFGSAAEKVIEIPAGSAPRQVVRLLTRGGALADERLAWRYVHWVKRDGRAFKAGEYAFVGPLTPDEVLERVYRGEVKVYHFTVPEGLRMEEIAAIIEGAGLGRASELLPLMQDASLARELGVRASNLEGYLFPDTYKIPKGMDPEDALSMMINKMREKYSDRLKTRASGLGLSENQVLTLASIIEKEAVTDEDRPLISAVYHNRLKKKMPLQADPTAIYGIKSSKEKITSDDLKRKTKYNTYMIKGLPPGPIASPGLKSITAALYPANVPYIYFVSNNDGTHHFSVTGAEHEAAVKRYREKKQMEKQTEDNTQ